MPLKLQSERVSPSGSMMSSGILNQLGRPNLDALVVLIREAFQNSWDARVGENTAIVFGINGFHLSDKQRTFLKQNIFADTPSAENLPLANVLHGSDAIDALLIYDRGTTGLSGVTRADVTVAGEKTSNFVNFMRNIGQPADRVFSGGTYGYGKAAFYRVSHAKTICVYTRCRVNGEFETRFMAASLGKPFFSDNKRYTGRFWWGVNEETDIELVEPLRGHEADLAAEGVGIPFFAENECGTSILILQPQWGERTPLQAVNLMAETILWNFWPKLMVQTTGFPAVKAEVFWQGYQVEIPAPEIYPPLQGFVDGLHKIMDSTNLADESLPDGLHRLKSMRPKQVLGHLALQEFNRSDISVFDTGSEPGAGAFSKMYHHTALMRQPKLVVKYLPGPDPVSRSKSYAGVFVAIDELDNVFASAETPTHDEWVASSLDQRQHRVFVNQTLRQIDQAMNAFALMPLAHSRDVELFSSVTGIARRLGKFLAPNVRTTSHQLGNGIAQPYEEQNLIIGEADQDYMLKASRSRRARINPCSQRLVISKEETPGVQVDFIVEHVNGSSGTSIKAAVYVLLDGRTREHAPPMGQRSPQLMYWLDSFGQQYPGTETIFLSVENRDICGLLVSVPDDVMVHIELTVVAD